MFMHDWNAGVKLAWENCVRLGVWREGSHTRKSGLKKGLCFPLYYELLLKNPEFWMRQLFKFLELPFDERVLRHHEFVNGSQIVRLSSYDYIYSRHLLSAYFNCILVHSFKRFVSLSNV